MFPPGPTAAVQTSTNTQPQPRRSLTHFTTATGYQQKILSVRKNSSCCFYNKNTSYTPGLNCLPNLFASSNVIHWKTNTCLIWNKTQYFMFSATLAHTPPSGATTWIGPYGSPWRFPVGNQNNLANEKQFGMKLFHLHFLQSDQVWARLHAVLVRNWRYSFQKSMDAQKKSTKLIKMWRKEVTFPKA